VCLLHLNIFGAWRARTTSLLIIAHSVRIGGIGRNFIFILLLYPSQPQTSVLSPGYISEPPTRRSLHKIDSTVLTMSPSSFSLAFVLAFALTPIESQSTECMATINALELRESIVAQTDPTFQEPRTYVLCPSSIFNIGILDADNKPLNGQEFIRARPNLHLKCGDDGKVENNCFVTGGDIHVDGTSFLGNTVATIENVTMEGITFTNAKKYSVWATKQGEITFIDCSFTVSNLFFKILWFLWCCFMNLTFISVYIVKENVDAMAPVYLDFYDADDVRKELSVAFLGCTFKVSIGVSVNSTSRFKLTYLQLS
jgi:hypothetical protein